MAKHQTRRSVSIRGATYATVLDDCQRRALSVSEYVEALIAADHAARGVEPMAIKAAPVTATPEVANTAPLRQSARTHNVASEAVAAAGRVAGRGAYQAAQREVREVANRLPLGIGVETFRRQVNGAARAAVQRRAREAMAPPPPIRSGFEPAPASAPGRPAGQRVATVAPPAPITKADPLAGVRSGRGGEVSF